MRLETPFTGKLAVLGVTARTGHFLALNGVWELRQGAVVYHQTRIGELEFGGATVIGEIKELRAEYGDPSGKLCLYAQGLGTTWLAEILDSGSHALSMEMDTMHYEQKGSMMLVSAGRVRGAMLVRADAFGWAGVRS